MASTNEIIMISLLIIPFIGMIFNSLKIFIKSENFDKLISPIGSIILLVGGFTLTLLMFNEVRVTGKISMLIENLAIDWLSAVFLLIIQSLYLIIGFFSVYYFKDKGYSKYFTLFFSLQLGLLISIMANHLFILFIGWELLVVTGYILVVFSQTKRAYEAGIKYLVISSYGSLLILFGLGLLTAVVPSLNFDELIKITTIMDSVVGKLAFSFILMGFGITAGMIFFNQWLPDAHPEAPAPVSGILSGIVVKVGIYAIYRTFALIALTGSAASTASQLLTVIAILTMTEGNLMVFAQFKRKDGVDYKRILAYSTTVHLGFLMLIASINTEFSTFALLFHILNHGLAKVLLFLLSGYFIAKLGTRDLNELKGIGSHDKIIGLSLFVGLMSLAGLPGTGGFISKLMVLLSFYQNQNITGSISTSLIIAIVFILINTAMAFIGYMWIIKKLIFDKPDAEFEYKPNERLDWIAKTTYGILAIIILVIGIFPNLYLPNII